MSKQKTLNLVKEFAKAAMAKQDNLAFEDRFVKFSMEKGYDAFDMFNEAAELMTLKQKLGDAADQDPRYYEVALQIAEHIASMYTQFCSDEELKELLPEAANDSEIQETLKNDGAPELSKLCVRLG